MIKRAFYFIFLSGILIFSCGDLLQRPPGSVIVISEVSAVPQNTSVTIVWTTDIPSTHLVRYGLVSGTYTDSTIESTTASTLHSVTIPSLGGDSTYFYVVENHTAGAATAVSAEDSFATASSIVISSLSSGTPTLTAATITWNTNVGATHQVEYGTAPSTYTTATVQSTSVETTHSVTLSGLTPATTYYYRVKNFATGYSNVTNTEQSFVTATEPAPTMAQKLRGIWIIGGLSTAAISSPVSQVDLYDPVTNTWYENVTTLPTAVSFAGVASSNGNIYVMGGFNSSGTVQSINQEYNVTTNAWATRLPIGGGTPAARANISAVTLNNRIYVIGGTINNYNQTYTGSTTTYEYHPATNTWTTKTAITVAARSEILPLAFSDVVYHLGGRSAVATLQTTHDGVVVSSAGLTGATEVVLTQARTGHCGVMYAPSGSPAMMVTIGGFSSLTGAGGCYAFYSTGAITTGALTNNAQYMYYPFSTPAAWSTIAMTPYPFSCGFSAAALYTSRVYVFGGATSYNSGPIANVYYLDLSNPAGSWTACVGMPNLPNGRFGHRTITIIP